MNVFPETQNYLDYDGFHVPSSCLHIGKLKKKTTKDDLRRFFLQYAPVKTIRIKEYNSEK